MLPALSLSLLGLLFRLEYSSQLQIPGVPETTFPCPSLPHAGSERKLLQSWGSESSLWRGWDGGQAWREAHLGC